MPVRSPFYSSLLTIELLIVLDGYRYATVEDVKSKEFKPSAYYKKMLGELRSQNQKSRSKNRSRRGGGRNRDSDDHQDRNRNRNSNRNRNRNRSRDHEGEDDNGDGSSGRGKRKLDDGDTDMVDPVEQEKRLQRYS